MVYIRSDSGAQKHPTGEFPGSVCGTMMHLLKNNDKISTSDVPPDIHNPPFYIPLKSIAQRYTLMQELGNGSFGSVTLAKIHSKNASDRKPAYHNTLMEDATIPNLEQENFYNKQRGLIAIKTMMTRLPKLNDYTRVREIKFILSMPAHKNLVKIFELFVDDLNYQLHIVMECMEENLYQLMRQRRKRVFSLPSLKSILSQILAGIRHIHAHNFFHRDIKPENILISPSNHFYSKEWLLDGHYRDNYIVKIADYGLARHVSNKGPYTAYVSTRWYRSPEILLRQGSYSRPIDVWAFGCVVVELATFRPLFPGSDEIDQIWKILEILGTPHSMPEMAMNGYVSNGGIWEQAKQLALRLNLKFPYVEGIDIESIVNNPQLSGLCQVIKACLVWDPKLRATVTDICDMPYFQSNIISSVETIMPHQKQHLSSLTFHENDENIAKPINHKKNPELLNVLTQKMNTDKNSPRSNSLAPNIIDFNGCSSKQQRDDELSFRQFLYETAAERDSDSTVSAIEDDLEISREFQSNFHAPELEDASPHGEFEEEVQDEERDEQEHEDDEGEEGNEGEEGDDDHDDDDEDSFVDYYVVSPTNYGPLQESSENDIPNYVLYPVADDIQRHHHCNILDDMSIDSSGSNQVLQGHSTTVQDHHSHSFTHTNSLTF